MVSAGNSEARPLLIRGGIVVNVFSGEVYPADILCASGHIAHVSAPGGLDGETAAAAAAVLDARGLYVLPGLVNGHLHIESSLITPRRYAAEVLGRGTMTLVADPHEIANVLGLPGLLAIMADAAAARADTFWTAPSCVPASPLETAGAELGPDDVAALLRDDRVVALGEVMNYPGVLGGDASVAAKIAAARAAGKPVDGHAPGLSGLALDRYVAAGVRSDHEAVTLAEARDKLRRGVWIMVRQGSAARNLTELLPLAIATGGERMMLVTDDRHPDDLLERGELDDCLRLAVAGGLDPVAAVRMATLNPAQYFGLADRGIVAPGRLADLWLVHDLRDFATAAVVRRGVPQGACAATEGAGSGLAANTVRLPADLPAKLRWAARAGVARVIGVTEGQIVTEDLSLLVETAADGRVSTAAAGLDAAKLAVVERHGRGGGVGLGIVSGLGLRRGAVASTVAHDSHNLIIAGANDSDMLVAARVLAESGGGFAVVSDGRVMAHLPLPIAGLMADLPAAAVARGLAELRRAAGELGCGLASPMMTLSFLALPVIPALKLTDRGLVDVMRFEHVDMWKEPIAR
jgi:adenine deaminase